jgi:hypothetical protein
MHARRENVAADYRDWMRSGMWPAVNRPIQTGMSCSFSGVIDRNHGAFTTPDYQMFMPITIEL